MSGDYFSCEIGWNDHMTTYNATYQMIVDICEYDKSYFNRVPYNCILA